MGRLRDRLFWIALAGGVVLKWGRFIALVIVLATLLALSGYLFVQVFE